MNKRFLLSIYILILMFGVNVSRIQVEARENNDIDMKYAYDAVFDYYYLCQNGDLFVMGSDGANYFGERFWAEASPVVNQNFVIRSYYVGMNGDVPFRIATNVKKIEVDKTHNILFIIKDDNSLWVRDTITGGEFQKVDNNVVDVYPTEKANENMYLYKKVDNSLWGAGNLSQTKIAKFNSLTNVVKPEKISENVKDAIFMYEQNNNYKTSFCILDNDGNLYSVKNGELIIAQTNVKEFNNNFLLTNNNELYFVPDILANEKFFVNSNIVLNFGNTYIGDKKINVGDGTVYNKTLEGIKVIKDDGISYIENYNYDVETKEFSVSEEKLPYDIKSATYNTTLTKDGDIYRKSYNNEVIKLDGKYTRLFDDYGALSTNNIGLMLEYQGICDFDFKTNGNEFIDRSYSSWAIPEINSAINEEIVPALLQKNYKNNITREDFCKLAVKMLMTKLDTNIYIYSSDNAINLDEKVFSDLNSEKSNREIVFAKEVGIINGYSDGTFKPEKNITREEAATLLCNLAKLLNIESADNKTVFIDNSSISNWATDSVYYVSEISDINGNTIMGGIGNNRFNPKGMYTREQAILTIYRVFNCQ